MNFPCISLWAYIFAMLTLVMANVSADMTIRYPFWTPTVCSIFTPMEAKYTHLDNSVPRYHLFDNNYNHEYIHLNSWCFKDNSLINYKGTFQRYEPFSLGWPCSPPWTRMPLLWYVVWMCIMYLLTKGYAGSRGWGWESQINYKTLMKHLM